jgi:hypothetical protein
MTDRIIIKDTSCTFSPKMYFTGDLESTINILQDWKEEGEWEGIEECWEEGCCCPSYQLYKHRPETDEEYKLRMEMMREREQEEYKRQKRQEVLARLSDEEKDLLGLSSSQSVPHKSQMPF